MEIITLNFLWTGSLCMLIFYLINNLCEIQVATAMSIASGNAGILNSMGGSMNVNYNNISSNSSGEYTLLIDRKEFSPQ